MNDSLSFINRRVKASLKVNVKANKLVKWGVAYNIDLFFLSAPHLILFLKPYCISSDKQSSDDFHMSIISTKD